MKNRGWHGEEEVVNTHPHPLDERESSLGSILKLLGNGVQGKGKNAVFRMRNSKLEQLRGIEVFSRTFSGENSFGVVNAYLLILYQ